MKYIFNTKLNDSTAQQKNRLQLTAFVNSHAPFSQQRRERTDPIDNKYKK